MLLDVKPTRVKDPGGSGKMVDDYWPSAQKVLTDPNFIRTLKDYDKDNVPPKVSLPHPVSSSFSFSVCQRKEGRGHSRVGGAMRSCAGAWAEQRG